MTPPQPEPPTEAAPQFTDTQLAYIKKLVDSAHTKHHAERLSHGDLLLAGMVVFFAFAIMLESRIAPSDGQTFQVMSAAMGGAAAILFANLRRGSNTPTPPTSQQQPAIGKVTVNA